MKKINRRILGVKETGSRQLWDDLHRTNLVMKRRPEFPFLRFKAGIRILDVGCGSASDLKYLGQQFELQCYGVDIALKRVIKKEREKNDIVFVSADASYLPFKDESFDIVYSFGTIEHTQRTFESVRDSFRVLKYGGQVVHTVQNLFSLHSLLARPLLKVLGRWRLGLERSFTLSEFHKMFRDVGFALIRYKIIPFRVTSQQFPSMVGAVKLFKTLFTNTLNLDREA